jgi:MFS family permease
MANLTDIVYFKGDNTLNADPSQTAITSPLAVNNVRQFIAFRVFFNCRFYYPVFTVLFLDFGLSVAQFSILNAVWAATIVLSEVPSGALADIVGRKRLLVFAACSMLVEMVILCAAPRGNINLLFCFFMVNRVLSGLAEAAASGADEAIAYDSLQDLGMADQWGRVLDIQMRLRSAVFILTMTMGAVVYDPDLMTRVAAFCGSTMTFDQSETLRFPVYLTLALAVLTLVATLRLDEARPSTAVPQIDDREPAGSVLEAFKLTLDSGRWILKTPFVLAVILFGMLFDGILRMVITLASQYYRMVQLPESIYGIIGSVMAVTGMFLPRLARWIAEHRSPATCLWTTAAAALSGLTGMAFFWPILGLVPALVAFSALYMVSFYVSYFVNQQAASSRRATVLSFKGLAYNLSYGAIGIVYAALLKFKKSGIDDTGGLSQAVENVVFMNTFYWFPICLFAGVTVMSAAALILRRRQR